MAWASASGDFASTLSGAGDLDSDAALVRSARTDPAAFEALYWRHQRAIWRYLRHRTGESHAADDLAAEVFLDLLRSLPGFRSSGIGVRGWLYRVATRKAARWSKRKRAVESFDDATHATAAAETGSNEALERVRVALNGLPQRCQAVLVLHHLEGLGIEEIATSLGVRAGTVKSRLARGREELRRRLLREGDPR